MRAIISPLFTAKNVRMMKSGIDHSVQRLLGNLNETLQRTRPGEPALVDVRQVCTAFALEVVAETVFGVRVDSLHTPNDPIVKNLRKLFGVNVGLRALVYIYCPWLARLLNLYLLDHHVLLYLHDFTKKLMNARLNERTRSPSSSATSSCSSAEQPVMTNPASAHLLSESRATNNTAGESANANLATGPTNPPKRRRLTPRAQENFITWLLDAEYQDSNGEIRSTCSLCFKLKWQQICFQF